MAQQNAPMTTKQAAEALGKSQFQVRGMVARGELWGAKAGGYLYVDSREVAAMAAKRQQ